MLEAALQPTPRPFQAASKALIGCSVRSVHSGFNDRCCSRDRVLAVAVNDLVGAALNRYYRSPRSGVVLRVTLATDRIESGRR